MSSEEENERLLTHAEVEEILKDSMEKPDKIYHGPEEDSNDRRTFLVDESVDVAEDEGELDPLSKLSFEKRATMDHVSGTKHIDKEKANEMMKELTDIERVSDIHAFKIAEIMPRDETELRPVFAKDRFTLEPEELKKIIATVDKYRI